MGKMMELSIEEWKKNKSILPYIQESEKPLYPLVSIFFS